MLKCKGEGCTYKKAWAFRNVGSKILCDECWGHDYGEETCAVCQLGCYEEDYDDDRKVFVCGKCQREKIHAAQNV